MVQAHLLQNFFPFELNNLSESSSILAKRCYEARVKSKEKNDEERDGETGTVSYASYVGASSHCSFSDPALHTWKCHLEKQQKTGQVVGLLPPTGETGQSSWFVMSIWGIKPEDRRFSPCLLLCLSNK